MMFSNETCTGEDEGTGPGDTGAPNQIPDVVDIENAVPDFSFELGIELGLLAGLAEGDEQPDFPSLMELAMTHRESVSGSSTSSTWSGGRHGRSRGAPRQLRAPRSRAITKGKELSRRIGRRAVEARQRREMASDASDVGADTDSDDQWTELDEPCSSESSSLKESMVINEVGCNGFQEKQEAEAPPMGQFLLPLLTAENETATPGEQFHIRHEDILQLLASAEESVRNADEDAISEQQLEMVANIEYPIHQSQESVSPEEEAALLRYICEGSQGAAGEETWAECAEWVLSVFHWWCENSALVYTMIGTSMSLDADQSEWLYRAHFGCHCVMCMSCVMAPLHVFIRNLLAALAHGERTMGDAIVIMRALKLLESKPDLQPRLWELPATLPISDDGALIIYDKLLELSLVSDIASDIVHRVCACRPQPKPLLRHNAVERLRTILESYKAAATNTFRVDILFPVNGVAELSPEATFRLSRYLIPYQRWNTRDRLRDMAQRLTSNFLGSMYTYQCDCLAPRMLCATQRKMFLKLSFNGLMQAVDEVSSLDDPGGQVVNAFHALSMREMSPSRELALVAASEAMTPPPPADQVEKRLMLYDDVRSSASDSLQDDESDGATSPSLGLSSSSLDSASEILLAAAAAVDAGASDPEAAPELSRTVRHLMRSIASIERLMDRVLKHCVEWPTGKGEQGDQNRSQVDLGLSEVDRKLMAMYRRLPDVHRKQLQVYHKQKKLSTVCMQLVGGCAPPPPAPGSPPPPASPPRGDAPALCPEYHLQRFKEVRRKVMHMRDQQMYYDRLRTWLGDQLKQGNERCTSEGNVTLIEDLPRRKRRNPSQKASSTTTTAKRKIRAHVSPSISKPHRLLQILKQKPPTPGTELNDDETTTGTKDDEKLEVDAPQAFSYDNHEQSDADTIVGDGYTDMSKEMKDFLNRFANVDINDPKTNPDIQLDAAMDVREETQTLPESISPPLQELSPTIVGPVPVYSSKSNQNMLLINSLLNQLRNLTTDKVADDIRTNFDSSPVIPTPDVLNISPINARRTPMLIEDVLEDKSNLEIKLLNTDKLVDSIENIQNAHSKCAEQNPRDPNVYNYVTIGMEIKKAMEECQNIINSYGKEDGATNENQTADTAEQKIGDTKEDDRETADADTSLSLEQIYEVMMSLDKNSAEFLEKMEKDNPDTVEVTVEEVKVTEVAEETPQEEVPEVNMPELVSELSKYVFKPVNLPYFMTMMSSMLEVNNESQLTPETLKQIRELKPKKCKDSVKVTKNTTKRKNIRKQRNSLDGEFRSSIVFESDGKDVADVSKYEKELENILMSETAQAAFNKISEYIDQAKDMDDNDPNRHLIRPQLLSKLSLLFDSSVKDALSLRELMQMVKCRSGTWKRFLAKKFKNIAPEILDREMSDMSSKFYVHAKELAEKQTEEEYNEVIKKIIEATDKERAEAESADPSAAPKKLTKRIDTQLDLRFRYIDVIKECNEFIDLPNSIMLDPEVAIGTILEMTDIAYEAPDNVPDFDTMSVHQKAEYFMNRLRETNRIFMSTIPKTALNVDEWIVLLYILQQLELMVCCNFIKLTPAKQKPSQPNLDEAPEAELLAGRGLSKLIRQSSGKNVKKPKPAPKPKPGPSPKAEDKPKPVETADKTPTPIAPKPQANNAKSKKVESISSQIKSCISLGKQAKASKIKLSDHIEIIIPEQIAASCDAISMETIKCCQIHKDDVEYVKMDPADDQLLTVAIDQDIITKYASLAVRSAKQTLNAVAFKNMVRNGQLASEASAPKTDCKWTSDCSCASCKNGENGAVCLGDIVKQCYEIETKSKGGADEAQPPAELKEPPPATKQPVKPQAKVKNEHMPNHDCKAHAGGCPEAQQPPSSGGVEQPCTCCYCTVFGQVPQNTTPVSRNYNETRERLLTILNKKKLKTAANTEIQETTTKPTPEVAPPQPPQRPQKLQVQTAPKTVPQKATQPPTEPASVEAKAETQEAQQNNLTDKMAKMTVSEKPDVQKAKTIQKAVLVSVRTEPAPEVNVEPLNNNAQPPKPQQQLPKPPQQPPKPPQQQPKPQQQPPKPQQQPPKPQQQSPKPQQQPPKPQQQPPKPQQQPQKPQQQQLKPQQQQPQQPPKLQTVPQQQPPQPKPQQQYKPRQPTPTPHHRMLWQQELMVQRQQQQQQQPQQQQPQQRQSRPQQPSEPPTVTSSRDTSILSTSSGCSGVSGNWRSGCVSDGSRIEDTRDLDALLQYIEGPTRHVDRWKKKAKKQRQKAKKLVTRLTEERNSLWNVLATCKRKVQEWRTSYAASQKRVEEVRAALKQAQPQKKKGKKQKLTPEQQANFQDLNEKLGQFTMLLVNTTKELEIAENTVIEYSEKLKELDWQLRGAHAVLLASEMTLKQQSQDPNAQQQPDFDPDMDDDDDDDDDGDQDDDEMEPHREPVKVMQDDKTKAKRGDLKAAVVIEHSTSGMVRVRRQGDGVSISLPDGAAGDGQLARMVQQNHQTSAESAANALPKKQTWEAALAHMHELAAAKEKKKKPKAEPKPTKPRPSTAPAAVETQPLSKKQRKLLAKQQAEEEEAKRQIQEAKSKRETKRSDPTKVAPEPAKGSKKAAVPVVETKKAETTKKTKEEKKEAAKKNDKAAAVVEKKAKPGKITPPVVTKQQQKQQPPLQNTSNKTKKNKVPEKSPIVNITSDTTLEIVGKKGPCLNDAESKSAATCSIMEQLSCGVQVGDLKLPPGITLTRVHPADKRENVNIKSVPAWKCNTLPAAPTPVARPQPVINADPSMMMFSTLNPEPPKQNIIISEPAAAAAAAVGKSKKAKKKAKKAAAESQNAPPVDVKKPDEPKMITLRNPMFHPNLPPVQLSSVPLKKPTEPIRMPEPMPIPQTACQATITPTSNGMYTIRNPLMSMMHQQSLMGIRAQTPQLNPVYPPNTQFPAYTNPNVYPAPSHPPPAPSYPDPPKVEQQPRPEHATNTRINLASFTQKNDDGYSLFTTTEEKPRFLGDPYYDQGYQPTVSPNPIGTRPPVDQNRYEDSSLFANNHMSRPEPIGTPLKPESDRIYTPFGQENNFHSALFQSDAQKVPNGDSMPYFQRLRVGAKLNNEVTIHHVNESKFFKLQEQQPADISLVPKMEQDSVFNRPYPAKSWTPGYPPAPTTARPNIPYEPIPNAMRPNAVYEPSSSTNSPLTNMDFGAKEEEGGFGAIGSQSRNGMRQYYTDSGSVFAPDRTITNLNELDSSERDIESFKRFDFYFEPPKNKPKINFNVHDIAAQLRPKEK